MLPIPMFQPLFRCCSIDYMSTCSVCEYENGKMDFVYKIIKCNTRIKHKMYQQIFKRTKVIETISAEMFCFLFLVTKKYFRLMMQWSIGIDQLFEAKVSFGKVAEAAKVQRVVEYDTLNGKMVMYIVQPERNSTIGQNATRNTRTHNFNSIYHYMWFCCACMCRYNHRLRYLALLCFTFACIKMLRQQLIFQRKKNLIYRLSVQQQR